MVHNTNHISSGTKFDQPVREWDINLLIQAAFLVLAVRQVKSFEERLDPNSLNS